MPARQYYHSGMDKAFVLSHFGGVCGTARALGIKSSSVSVWGETVPYSAIGRIAMLWPEVLDAWRNRAK